MAQTTSGIHSLLSHPLVYETFQQVVGSPRVRRELVGTYVKPHPGLRVLDIGCGPGDLIRDLDGAAYTGTDLSAAYIDSAKKRFGDRGRYFAGAVEDLDSTELGEFDVVIAKSLIHHIDEDEALHLFEVASSVLAPQGHLVTLDAAYTSDMSRASRWVVSRDRGQSILSPEGYKQLARRAFGEVTVKVHHDLLRIPYTHVFMQCSQPLPGRPSADPGR
ncbi:MAG: class I SAM-dependent methyltransferase [Nocardioidaceae bacterium]